MFYFTKEKKVFVHRLAKKIERLVSSVAFLIVFRKKSDCLNQIVAFEFSIYSPSDSLLAPVKFYTGAFLNVLIFFCVSLGFGSARISKQGLFFHFPRR